MKLNEAGLALIKHFEGCSLTAYQDIVGVWTIGYGDTRDVKLGQTISQAEADVRLLERLAEFEAGVGRLLGSVLVNSNEFSAMVSLAYNIGLINFANSHVLTFAREGDKLAAANSFLLWDKAGGKTVPGLARRRAAERALFLEPEDGPAAA